MKYYMEVKVYNAIKSAYEWKKVKPTNGEPYEYNSHEEAYKMLDNCYPFEVYGKSVKITSN